MPVHPLRALPADMDLILAICTAANNLRHHRRRWPKLLGLAATANSLHGAPFGDYGCFSFFPPRKNLGGAGDGRQLITTNEPSDRGTPFKCCASMAARQNIYHEMIGTNSRLHGPGKPAVLARESCGTSTPGSREGKNRARPLSPPSSNPPGLTSFIAAPAAAAPRKIRSTSTINSPSALPRRERN